MWYKVKVGELLVACLKEFYMKVNGKFAALAGAALLLGSAAFAQANTDYELPEGFSFKNVVSSDVITLKNSFSDSTDYDKNSWRSEFGGLEEKLEINYNSEKIGFQFAPKVKIGEVSSQNGLDSLAKLDHDDTGIFYSGMDWNFRFSPFDSIDIFLKSGNGTPGAGMMVAGNSAGAGDLGSDGLTIMAKPIDGLKLAATVPFTFGVVSEADFFNAEKEDDPNYLVSGKEEKIGKIKFDLGLGAEYAFANLFTVGATWKDVLDASNMTAGVYFDITAIQNVNVHVGYTFAKNGNSYNFTNIGTGKLNDKYARIFGQHFVNASAKVAIADFTVAADVGFNLMTNQSLYDLYAGLSVGYDLVPGKFNIGLASYVGLDLGTAFDIEDDDEAYGTSFQSKISAAGGAAGFDNGDHEYADASWFEDSDVTAWKTAPIIGIKPSIKYTSGNHTFEAAACFDYILNSETTNFAKFPVSWTYTF